MTARAAWTDIALRSAVAVALLVSGCTALPPGELRLEALDLELTLLEQQGMAGQVLVAVGGECVYVRGVGTIEADGAPSRRIGPDTVFPLLSLTKPFTGAAVLALTADGHIRLDDPLGLHIEGLIPPWADIPVHALLTHTSGVSPEIVDRAWTGDPRLEPVSRAAFLERVQRFPPRPPAFRYSNVGYGMLGALIETVSGMSFEQYLRVRLLEPAGLTGIGFLLPEWTASDVAAGRIDGRSHLRYVGEDALPDGAGFNLRASGDLHASAVDIFRWWQRIRTRAWLGEAWSDAWLAPRVREPDGSRYGYGWHFRTSRHGRVVGHTGGDHVHAVDFSWYVDADVMIYIATAEARFQADLIRERLHAGILGAPLRRRAASASRSGSVRLEAQGGDYGCIGNNKLKHIC